MSGWSKALLSIGAVLILSACGVGRLDEPSVTTKDTAARSDRAALRRHIRRGNLEGVRSLLEAGLDPTPALPLAAKLGRCEVLAILLDGDANPDGLVAARALVFAESGDFTDCVSSLLQAGVTVDGADTAGETLLVKEARKGSLTALEDLIALGADVEAKTNLGSTALLEAVGSGCETCVALLLSAKATVDLRDRDGWTSLMMASRLGSGSIVRLLMEGGAGVNLESNLGWRPLTLAVFGGHMEVTRLLLEAGAELSSRSVATRSAIRWAEWRGYRDVLDLLPELDQEPLSRDRGSEGPG